MNDILKTALDAAYAKYLEGCEKRKSPVVWNYQEWLDGSIIAAAVCNEHWTPEDNK